MNRHLSYVSVAYMAVASMLLAACGARPNVPAATAAPPEKVLIRWGIGLGTGNSPDQIIIEDEVVADFNASQDRITLVYEVIPGVDARDTIATQISAGVGPDLVGPVGWAGSNYFSGQWLDIAPYVKSSGYDTSKFESALVRMYQTEAGMVGLPIAVYPSTIYYNTGLFSEAGLNPLPARYGEKYQLPDGSLVDWNWETLTRVARLLTTDSTGKHSGEAGFDPTSIIQYGFSFGWEGHPNYWGTFMSNGGQILVPGGSRGSYQARIPELWKTAWQWVYNGIWGSEPYIPNDTVSGSAEFNTGNVFTSGRIGMVEMPAWYLCCISDLVKAGGRFEFAAMPVSLDGQVAGRVDADTFRIWKGTKHPAEAFTVLAYLVDTGIYKLVVGTPDRPPAYGAIPGQAALRGPWLAAQKAAFPFVKNWQVLLAGLNYPDVPSAENFMPTMNEAWDRIQTFGSLLGNTRDIDLAAQETVLESDLTLIFNK